MIHPQRGGIGWVLGTKGAKTLITMGTEVIVSLCSVSPSFPSVVTSDERSFLPRRLDVLLPPSLSYSHSFNTTTHSFCFASPHPLIYRGCLIT
jgi:hypothetical protein